MKNKKGKKSAKKKKINYKRFLIFIVLLFLLAFFVYKFMNINITNIYIKGNNFLTDQEIIDISGLKNYPNSIKNISFSIKNKLEKNQYILSANVYKGGFNNKVYIEVEENYPLFYYQSELRTILFNGEKVEKKFSVPTVINQIPSKVYNNFLKSMQKIDVDILYRMSEIEYKPNDVDSERFFILMNDSNYVYLTLNKFLTINRYLDMMKQFTNKKGILYLDSGEYFDVFE